MSRIFEALQRADREQKSGQVPVIDAPTEPIIGADVAEPSPAMVGVALENITQHSWNPSIPSLPCLTDRCAAVEQFRSLRSRVFQAHYDAPLKTILVSSGIPSEGKSFVAANLAISLARNGVNQTLLIDGDLRRPTLHTLLGAPNAPGLAEYLTGTAELQDILQRNRSCNGPGASSVGSLPNLTFIPSGKCGDDSSELVANHRIEQLITSLSPLFDWIVIDSPPVLAVSDAADLARAADAILIVAREGRTPSHVAQRVHSIFSKSRILGFVLNGVKLVERQGYYYSGYYGGQGESGKTKRGETNRSPE
jgi:protein-tyrosine kinase